MVLHRVGHEWFPVQYIHAVGIISLHVRNQELWSAAVRGGFCGRQIVAARHEHAVPRNSLRPGLPRVLHSAPYHAQAHSECARTAHLYKMQAHLRPLQQRFEQRRQPFVALPHGALQSVGQRHAGGDELGRPLRPRMC